MGKEWKVLVVCVGNICRSPMAAALMAMEMGRAGSAQVSSAGLSAMVGSPPDPMAIELMRMMDLDISEHRARQLDEAMVRDHDLVLVMEGAHKTEFCRRYPWARGKVFLLGMHNGIDIADPYQRSREEFERAFLLICQGVAEWSEQLGKKTA